MRFFSDKYLDSYCREQGRDMLQSVGCYALEKVGIQLFDKIDGDYFSILGLPLLELLSYFREIGLVTN